MRFAIANDLAGALRFTPLGAAQPDGSIVVVDAAGRYERSAAVVRVLRALRAPWPLAAAVLARVPVRLADAAYDYVAAHRRAWFGSPAACDLPTPAERARFVD